MRPLLLAVELVSVPLLSGDTRSATPDHKRVRQDTPVDLVVAVVAEDHGERLLLAGAERVDLGDGLGLRAARPWPASEPIAIDWFKIEPTVGWVDNEAGGFHWANIPYAETPWPSDRSARRSSSEDPAPWLRLARRADVQTTILPDRGGLGTMAFKVRVTAGGRSRSTPGAESRFRGGLSPSVARVTVRRDDDFLGYLTELYNTPYVWASAGSDDTHQAERNVGSDCADFIAYGLRRAGRAISYGSTFDVPRWGGGRPIARIAAIDRDGRFLDDRGGLVRVGRDGVQPGDLLLFHRHVGAFSEDRPPRGVLDGGDLLMHTAWAPPVEETLFESRRFTAPPFTVWRVPESPNYSK